MNGSVKEPNKFHNYGTEEVTRKCYSLNVSWFIIYLLHGLYRTLSHSQSEESQVRGGHKSVSEKPAVKLITVDNPRCDHVTLDYIDICVVVHDDLGCRMEQHVVIGFGELAAVD